MRRLFRQGAYSGSGANSAIYGIGTLREIEMYAQTSFVHDN